MAILQVLQYPDLRLRRKGYKVGNVKAVKIQKTINDMLETLAQQKGCAALAATQLAIEDPPSIIVINQIEADLPLDPTNSRLCLINLQIITREGKVTDDEGCMSVYPKDIYAKVTRASQVKVKALDNNGNELEFVATDILARCLQHEYDHLQGILYIDHLTEEERRQIEEKMAKLRKRI